jgi:hypothetical protein
MLLGDIIVMTLFSCIIDQVAGQSWCMQKIGRHVIVDRGSKVFCFDAGVLLWLKVFSILMCDCLDIYILISCMYVMGLYDQIELFDSLYN